MQQFEYKIEETNISTMSRLADELNSWMVEGWETFQVHDITDHPTPNPITGAKDYPDYFTFRLFLRKQLVHY